MVIARQRWVIIKDDEIFCGLSRNYKFKTIDNIGDAVIKTYLSKKKAESSFEKDWSDGEELLKSGQAEAIEVTESLYT